MGEDNKFMAFLNSKIMGPMGKLAATRIVRAIMAAGLASIPFTIVGSMFLVLNILPTVFTGLTGFFNATFVKITDLYMVANKTTMGILALYFTIVIGYEYTRIIRDEEKLNIDPVNGALLAVFAYFMTIPELVIKGGMVKVLSVSNATETVVNGWRAGDGGLARLGTAGIFTGIIMALLAVKIYQLIVKKNWVIRMPEQVPAGVAKSFTALIPTFVIAFVVLLIEGILVALNTDIYNVIALPFGFVTNLTNSWLGVVVIELLISLLWVLGIHGANIIGAFITPITLNNLTLNSQGAHMVFAGEFNNMFVIIGGSGATLGLVFFMTFMAKSAQLKVLGRAAIAPAFFNINEPIIFGAPVVYNPYLAIPFMLAPVVTSSLTYWSIKLGITHQIIAQMPWPSPVGIGAFLGTGGDIPSVILAFVNVIAAGLVYYPFARIYDRKLLAQEQANLAAEQA
ncbi:cellobiose-specific PTS system IIC component [Ligilactobacillus salitolerans]|uniref:Permease IIC component n=1 Tax=Ligilactobacillus salitolerans TaxID=1808352 RepID=A0A401IUG5_9LACO|nr:PTS cellobiose transporter subunit IIC [Ligilactobacillus salitolerans]GBG95156.1 cellobiose-specific PTS system IIC component [Ligilactobacillus salitolerans]